MRRAGKIDEEGSKIEAEEGRRRKVINFLMLCVFVRLATVLINGSKK